MKVSLQWLLLASCLCVVGNSWCSEEKKEKKEGQGKKTEKKAGITANTSFFLKFRGEKLPITKNGFERLLYFKDFKDENYDDGADEVVVGLMVPKGVKKEVTKKEIEFFIKLCNGDKAVHNIPDDQLLTFVWFASAYEADFLGELATLVREKYKANKKKYLLEFLQGKGLLWVMEDAPEEIFNEYFKDNGILEDKEIRLRIYDGMYRKLSFDLLLKKEMPKTFARDVFMRLQNVNDMDFEEVTDTGLTLRDVLIRVQGVRDDVYRKITNSYDTMMQVHNFVESENEKRAKFVETMMKQESPLNFRQLAIYEALLAFESAGYWGSFVRPTYATIFRDHRLLEISASLPLDRIQNLVEMKGPEIVRAAITQWMAIVREHLQETAFLEHYDRILEEQRTFEAMLGLLHLPPTDKLVKEFKQLKEDIDLALTQYEQQHLSMDNDLD